MKHLIIISFFLAVVADFASAQLLVSSYERNVPFYFCNGAPQMSYIKLEYVFANITPDVRLHVDSVVYFCDTAIFKYPAAQKDSFSLGYFALMSTNYKPKTIGTDTFRVRAYYNNTYAEGTMIAHAANSPDIGFFGGTTMLDTIFGTHHVGVSNYIISPDTLHDDIGGLEYSDSAITEGLLNYSIIVRSCGEVTIDSIYTVGDFSDIQIQNIPSLPYAMTGNSDLVMSYKLTPRKAGQSPHYLVIHTTSGKYLVWSFEYTVYGSSDVKAQPPIALLTLSPNPATNRCTIRLHPTPGEHQTLTISDLTGKPVLTILQGIAQHEYEELETDLSPLPNGIYYVTYSTATQSTVSKLVIAR